MHLYSRYAHAYTSRPHHPGYAAAWPQLLSDIDRILDRVRAAGIGVTGPVGGRPLVDPYRGVAFDGDASRNLAHDTFALAGPWTPTTTKRGRQQRAICATNRLPYDLAVCAVLLHCLVLLPGLIQVTSNGRWEREWAYGAAPSDPLSDTGFGARTVISELFATEFPMNLLNPGQRIY
jgi:hypothetical protein